MKRKIISIIAILPIFCYSNDEYNFYVCMPLSVRENKKMLIIKITWKHFSIRELIIKK